MVRAKLLEPQCPAMECHILRPNNVFARSRRDRTKFSRSSPSSARRAMANEAIRGHGQGTYVTLGRRVVREGGI